jgi:hypothetical protein
MQLAPLYSRQGNLTHMTSLLDAPRTRKTPAAQAAIDNLIEYHQRQREYNQSMNTGSDTPKSDNKPRTIKRDKKRK